MTAQKAVKRGTKYKMRGRKRKWLKRGHALCSFMSMPDPFHKGRLGARKKTHLKALHGNSLIPSETFHMSDSLNEGRSNELGMPYILRITFGFFCVFCGRTVAYGGTHNSKRAKDL